LSAGPTPVGACAGAGGKRFGSVRSAYIVTAVLDRTGVELERRNVLLDDPIRELGDVEVPVRLHPDVVVTLAIAVVAQ